MSSILQVPHRPQLADGYCLPACVQMVLAYWGIEQDQTRLARQLGMIRGAGVPASRLRRLNSQRLAVAYQSGPLAELRTAIDQGIPPSHSCTPASFHTGTLQQRMLWWFCVWSRV